MPKSAGYVDADSLRRIAAQLHPFKQRLYDLLQLKLGDNVLVAACGPGIDTIPLAPRVGPGGQVVGIDLDEEMIALATAEAQTANVAAWVHHRAADILDLPFEPESFDACVADRLLQVLPASIDPQQALAAMYRVTRPGSWVAVGDADWGSVSADAELVDVERRMARFLAEGRPNGYAGRQLYRLFRRQGFVDVMVELHPVLLFVPQETPFYERVPQQALAAGVITPDEAQQWRAWITQAGEARTFFGSVQMVSVAGRVPP
jgi:ubiquinone/menaquinone biosynthesis C-methylase UbiE